MDKALFATQIRQALRNLHDFADLQRQRLTRILYAAAQDSLRDAPRNAPGALAAPTLEGTVRTLRTRLLAAIDRLNPHGAVSPRAKESRPYRLMYGRYVQGLGTPELVKELAISVRQLRREHTRALNTVVDMLWAELGEQLSAEFPPEPPAHHSVESDSVESQAPDSLPADPRRTAAQSEVGRLVDHARIEEIDARPLLRAILSVLAPVAAKFDARIVDCLPDRLPTLRADRIVLRQGLLEILSYALHNAVGGQLRLEHAGQDAASVTLAIVATGGKQPKERAGVGLDVGQRLLSGMGGHVEIQANEQSWQAQIALATATDSSILVIDDNAGMIQLFRRYLARPADPHGVPTGIPGGISLLEAHSAEQAIDLALKTPLRLAILDIMMPGQDGWEILQHLRLAPETSALPIVVCSVLNEPEIAYGLGASGYLPKPVTEDAFLTLVERWCAPSP